MDQITSPDIPAWLCYLLVISLGMLVARDNVNQLLASQPGHWGFANTWALFGAHSAIPVVLFWFLDYTSALRDTSLFAALVVAFGYRQIFAGGIQGITMPGPTPRLWQPFEAWVNRIKDQIATQYKNRRDLFDTEVRTYLASDAQRIQGLVKVSFTYTLDPAALAAARAALAAQAVPAGAPADSFEQWRNNEEVRILLDDLRRSQPVNYGLFLYEHDLITLWMYHSWLQSAQSRWIGWIATVLIGLAIVIGAITCYRSENVSFRYYQWRMTKPGVSDRDRFRTKEYLVQRLQKAGQATPPDLGKITAIASPLIARLRFRGTPPQTAEDILTLFTDAHSPGVDLVAIPGLIEALRNPNEDLRLRIRRELSGLQQADFPKVAPDESADKWVPAKNESAVEIDRRVSLWQEWWKTAQAPVAPPGG
jgi:hypothetical protein